jgi:hypothetical protein
MKWSGKSCLLRACLTIQQDVGNYKVFCKDMASKAIISDIQQFGLGCNNVLEYIGELVLLGLYVICERKACQCLVKCQSLKMMFDMSQSVLFILARFQHSQETFIVTPMELQSLLKYFTACVQEVNNYKYQLLALLQECDVGHDALLCKFGICFMEE